MHHPPLAPLDELWDLMQSDGGDEAVDRLAERLDCSPRQISPDWKCFAPIAGGQTVLEIGGGFGEDTKIIGEQAERVVSLVPTDRHGQVLRRRLETSGATNVEVEVVPDLADLPLADDAVDTLVVEDINVTGFDVTGASLDATIAAWRRVVAPDGSVFVGLSNPWDRRGGLRFLRSALKLGRAREPFNRRVRRAGQNGPGGVTLGRITRSMQAHGFAAPAVYAPLPDRDRIQLVVPVEDRRVVRYCFTNLLRQNSLAMRSAIAAADGAVSMGLFKHLVPFYFLVFRAAAR